MTKNGFELPSLLKYTQNVLKASENQVKYKMMVKLLYFGGFKTLFKILWNQNVYVCAIDQNI